MGEAKLKFNKKTVHLFIATPMYGGMCSGLYTASMLKMITELEKRAMRYNYLFRFNESLIDRARNSLAANFLKSECTHLLFIDADIGFNPKEVLKMVDADKDIICGIYPSKAINWQSVADAAKNNVAAEQLEQHSGNMVVNFINQENGSLNVDEPFEILYGGTGMMLIKREVFETLQKTVEHYCINESDSIMKKLGESEVARFFATSIHPEWKVLLSEDYHFCKTWRDVGGKVWAAPWVNLSHVGTHTFSGRLIKG